MTIIITKRKIRRYDANSAFPKQKTRRRVLYQYYMNTWIKPSTEQILEVKKVVWGKNGMSTRFSLTPDKRQIFQASFSPLEKKARWSPAFISVLTFH